MRLRQVGYYKSLFVVTESVPISSRERKTLGIHMNAS